MTGVSSGIGLAQASLFLEKGYQVYGVDKNQKPNLTGDFHFLQLDLTDELSPLFDWLVDVDIICNTAGILWMTTGPSWGNQMARCKKFLQSISLRPVRFAAIIYQRCWKESPASSSICAPSPLSWLVVAAQATRLPSMPWQALPSSWPWIMQTKGFKSLAWPQVPSKRP